MTETTTEGRLFDEGIEALLTQRREAKAAKNFAEGDRIRTCSKTQALP